MLFANLRLVALIFAVDALQLPMLVWRLQSMIKVMPIATQLPFKCIETLVEAGNLCIEPTNVGTNSVPAPKLFIDAGWTHSFVSFSAESELCGITQLAVALQPLLTAMQIRFGVGLNIRFGAVASAIVEVSQWFAGHSVCQTDSTPVRKLTFLWAHRRTGGEPEADHRNGKTGTAGQHCSDLYGKTEAQQDRIKYDAGQTSDLKIELLCFVTENKLGDIGSGPTAQAAKRYQ